MLQPARFAGTEQTLLTKAHAFWQDFSQAVAQVAPSRGDLKRIEKRRLIVFLDSDAQLLRANGYIVRVRRALGGRRADITLKFRHPDRYVAESRRLKDRRARTTSKFEEDIKAPFASFYSLSFCGEVSSKRNPSTVGDVVLFFPGLEKRFDAAEATQRVTEVNGLTSRELVITGGSLQIDSNLKTYAECALIVWYDENGSNTAPVAVEFSYRYGDAAEKYRGRSARRAHDVFQVLQNDLGSWVDPNSRTKTALVYEYSTTAPVAAVP